MTEMQTVILMLYISSAMAYLHYQDAIPNGDVIPYPGKPNHLWQGVGHKNPLGAGVRNPFGVNFAENGHVSEYTCIIFTKLLKKTGSIFK